MFLRLYLKIYKCIFQEHILRPPTSVIKSIEIAFSPIDSLHLLFLIYRRKDFKLHFIFLSDIIHCYYIKRKIVIFRNYIT